MKLSEGNKAFLRRLGFSIANPLISFVCASLIKKVVNGAAIEELEKKGERFVVAFWHGKMLYGWYRFKKSGSAGLTSQSKDGDILAEVLRKWGYRVIRGSSSKGGRAALNEMIAAINDGKNLCITPDGPKGPPMEMKAGAAVVANKTGVPLILMGISYKRKSKLRSWDRFEIPHPFSFIKIAYSDPIYFNQEISREELSGRLPEIQKEFNRVQALADKPFFRK
ncbi:MAG: lysophospholipid acyltransferase family protein [Ignavibacteriales bacterium]|nr:MAG: lysophospholipid acyltransferase family protein [Ignavibacteriaceae bacterium]MBW7874280.1 lysophospholipid acyltransferase family protein [Ignavibacteria bacterium]MCZ2142676.1 lysophospholipid acyltransferase family protein [Ignavibacteriales bacterium]OQY71013.1 MAG: hypothetical protein B6D45_10525 [Ignavibacteriales bacterium UTCHB3]MBV6443774.1 hypothetical protein [Ignavibacteriaceae bacterium]